MKATTVTVYKQIVSMIDSIALSNEKFLIYPSKQIFSKAKEIVFNNSNLSNKEEFECKFSSAFSKVSKINRNFWMELLENFKQEEKENVDF